MNISLSDFNFDDISESGGKSCFSGGLEFGIFDSWNHDSLTNRIGESNCGFDYTGSRWDPWHACSPISNSEYCITSTLTSDDKACIDAASYLWDDQNDGSEYVCDPILYSIWPYYCEVGDWSGKYGNADYDNSRDLLSLYSGGSAFEAEAFDLSGKAIVFRCNTGDRVFCAPFVEYEDSITEEEIASYPRKTVQNDTYSQIAVFDTGDSDNTDDDDDSSFQSYILLTYYGKYEIVIDLASLTIPGNCGNEILYRIYDTWDSNSNCADEIGNFYDPTITCVENSDMDAKGYCTGSYLCNDDEYEYDCDYSGDVENRFQCAPGDLSGKYGSIDISSSSNFFLNMSGYDPLMIAIEQLEGKSVALLCGDDRSMILACAGFTNYTADAGLYGSNTATSKKKKKKKSNDEPDTILGLSSSIFWAIFTLVAVSAVPCIVKFKKSAGTTDIEKKQKEAVQMAKHQAFSDEKNNRKNNNTVTDQSGEMNTEEVKANNRTKNRKDNAHRRSRTTNYEKGSMQKKNQRTSSDVNFYNGRNQKQRHNHRQNHNQHNGNGSNNSYRPKSKQNANNRVQNAQHMMLYSQSQNSLYSGASASGDNSGRQPNPKRVHFKESSELIAKKSLRSPRTFVSNSNTSSNNRDEYYGDDGYENYDYYGTQAQDSGYYDEANGNEYYNQADSNNNNNNNNTSNYDHDGYDWNGNDPNAGYDYNYTDNTNQNYNYNDDHQQANVNTNINNANNNGDEYYQDEYYEENGDEQYNEEYYDENGNQEYNEQYGDEYYNYDDQYDAQYDDQNQNENQNQNPHLFVLNEDKEVSGSHGL